MRSRSDPRDRVPESTGPDEETVRIETVDFRRRRQAARRRRHRRLALAGLVLVLLLGAGWAVLFSGLVTVEQAQVTGTRALGTARVERVAQVPTGTPLARADLDAIRARVETIDAVRRAEVSRSWPHTVRIAVTERTPVAVIDRGQGLQALDATGVLFGHYAKRPARLPLVRAEPDTGTEALVEGSRVISSLPPQVERQVDTVEVTTVDEIQLVLRKGRRVLWGSSEDSQDKADVLAVLLRRPGTRIDVSVPGRPTTSG